MPGEEILELGRSKQRPASPPRVPSVAAEPIHLDIQGQDEEEPPPPPRRRVKLTVGAIVGVVSGLLAGAAGWNAIDDWRTVTAARGATDLVAFLRDAGPVQDLDAVSATFTIFNSGEHPVTVEGISVTGWEPRNPDRDMSRDIDPGESALVQTTFSMDCEAPRPRETATHALLDVRTADGQSHSVDLPFAQWENLAGARDWICSPSMGYGGVWADLSSPEWGEGSVTLDMHLQSDREVTVVGVESTNPAFSVETTELPQPVEGPSGGSIASVWRVVDCVAAQNFELSGMLLRLTLDDGRTQEIDVSYGPGFASLIRLTERSCPAS